MAAPERFDPEPIRTGFGETWKRVVTDSRRFFAEMPEVGGLGEPLAFLAVCAGLHALGRLIVTFDVGSAAGAFVAQVVGAGVTAAVLVLVAQHLFDGRAGFEPTFRAVAYAAAPTVVAWVPRLGVLGIVYAWFLVVRGLERVQAFDAVRAALATAIGVAVSMVLLGGLAGTGLPR